MASRPSTLWQWMAGQRLRYACAIVALCIGTLLLYLSPLMIRAGIDSLAEQGATRVLALAGAGVILVTGPGGVFTYLRGRWSAIAAERIARRLRDRLYDHLQHLPCTWHDTAQTGDIVQRCTSDV